MSEWLQQEEVHEDLVEDQEEDQLANQEGGRLANLNEELRKNLKEDLHLEKHLVAKCVRTKFLQEDPVMEEYFQKKLKLENQKEKDLRKKGNP